MTLEEAEARLSLIKKEADHSRRGFFHFSPEAGWMNDPNGFCFFHGHFHIFYQYHLSDGRDDPPVCWGHAMSDDLIHFEYLPIALAPDMPYDKDGCWSGSAIEKDGILYLFYTGHVENMDGSHSEAQCLATSKDGITFAKSPLNPVVPASLLPDFISHQDFRDPYVFMENGIYHMVIGSNLSGTPVFVFFSSSDLLHWTYEGKDYEAPGYGKQIECPCLTKDEESHICFFSAQDILPRDDCFWNVSSSLYCSSSYDNKGLRFIKQPKEIDHGLDFYAPQIVSFKQGNILSGWLGMWGRRFPFLKDNHIDSSFSLFRLVSLDKDGKLIQKPLPLYDSLFKENTWRPFSIDESHPLISSSFRIGLLQLSFERSDPFVLHLFSKDDHEIRIAYKDGKIVFDRSKGSFSYEGNPRDLGKEGRRECVIGELTSLDIYIDTNSIELFINAGEETMTCSIAEPLDRKGYRLEALGKRLVGQIKERPVK